MLVLEVKTREIKESPEKIRSQGLVPAVFYGPKEPATPIAIDSRSFERIWKQSGETTIITLKGAGEDKDTLIRDIQFHPVTGDMLHADFYVIEKGKKIEIKVPVEWKGMAPAEKAGHIVSKALHEVEIKVAPNELPKTLIVDLSKLEKVGDRIIVADIKLPPSASLITEKDEIVASVTEFKEESKEIKPAPQTEILTAKPAAEGEGAAPEKKEGKEKKE